jgi:GT2 family glycosyltransferase
VEALESVRASSVEPEMLICVAQEYSARDLAVLADAAGPEGLVALDDNIGFAPAVNLGMARAVESGIEWMLVLNNDATIAGDCIERCLKEALIDDRIALVAPAIAYADDRRRLWFADGRHSDWLDVPWDRGPFHGPFTPPPSRDCDYAPTCCVLLSTTAWRDVGAYRAEFFMYYEDVDWCNRARSRGWRIRYLGEVLCRHEMASSAGESGSRYLTETSAYYLARNPLRHALDSPGLRRVTRVLGILAIWGAWNATRIRPSEWPTVGRAYLEGLSDGWSRRMGRRDVAQGLRRKG